MEENTDQGLATRTVSLEEHGTRLDRCLRLWIPHLPQSLIEKAVRKGDLKLQNVKAKASTRVEEGQILSFPQSFLNLETEVPKRVPKALTHTERKWLKSLILYEDADILALNKPAGIAVQGGTNQKKSLDAMLQLYDAAYKPRLVHRLDLDTSGVLVFAKTLPMARWLSQAFKERTVQKIYWALVCGVPKKSEGMISLALAKRPDPLGEKVRVDEEKGVRATTFYRVIEALGNRVAWLELVPKTGRTHQLRVHCAEGLKTPILGDGKYGGKEAFPLGRKTLHLHAHALILPLPHGKTKTIEAPLSKAFDETFQNLGFGNV
ncbi:MAG: RluA family pseudouridine synthase [Alphaproteobacteria bacterium]|nr:RluA family pseudouridine synthase [Alphaproteobacteria bacterium]